MKISLRYWMLLVTSDISKVISSWVVHHERSTTNLSQHFYGQLLVCLTERNLPKVAIFMGGIRDCSVVAQISLVHYLEFVGQWIRQNP